jgi:hypothetical protein
MIANVPLHRHIIEAWAEQERVTVRNCACSRYRRTMTFTAMQVRRDSSVNGG